MHAMPSRHPSRSRRALGIGGPLARIVWAAARWIYQGRRLDMQGLADELGVSRVTLFRAAYPRHDPAHQRDGRRVRGPAPAAGRRARPDHARSVAT